MSYPDQDGPDRDAPALALIEETQAINAATGDNPVVHTSLVVAVWCGQAPRARELIQAGILDAAAESGARITSVAA